jgi:hypothetical protein
MIGDHHGRTAGRATLLVRAVEEILGTHSVPCTALYGGELQLRPVSRHRANWWRGVTRLSA